MANGVVQNSGFQQLTSGANATLTLNGVVANDCIRVAVLYGNSNQNGIGTQVSDGVNTYTLDKRVAGFGGTSNSYSLEMWEANAVAAGNYTITVAKLNGTNGFGNAIAFETIPIGPLDQVSSNVGNSTTPTCPAPATLSTTTDVAIALLATELASVAGWTVPPTGSAWVDAANDTSVAHGPMDFATEILSSTTGPPAAWGTLTTGCKWMAIIAAYPQIASSGVTITAVGASGVVTPGVAFSVTGTGFLTSQGAGSVQILDPNGTNSVTEGITTWSTGTSIACSAMTLGNVRYGSATLKVTNNSGQSATFPITIAPAANNFITNLATLLNYAAISYPAGIPAPERLVDITTSDLVNNSQVLYSIGSGTAGTFGLSVNADGTFQWDPAVGRITWSWIAPTNGVWAGPYQWDLVGPFPFQSGPNISTQTWTQGVAITPVQVATSVGESDTLEFPLVYSISGSGNPLPAGTAINSSSGVISGTPTAAGTTANVIVRVTDAQGSYYEFPGFTATVQAAASPNVQFSGLIPDQTQGILGTPITPVPTAGYFTNATSYALGGGAPAWMHFSDTAVGVQSGSTTGIVVGTPNDSIPPGGAVVDNATVTGSNAVPSNATSNIIAFTVNNPATPPPTAVGNAFPGTTLLVNGSAPATPSPPSWTGGKGLFIVVGSVGAVVNLQVLGPDAATWLTFLSVTSPGEAEFELPAGTSLRATVSGTAPGVYANVAKISPYYGTTGK